MLKKDKKTFVIYLTISFTLLLIAFGLYYFFMVEFDKLESERMIFSSENTLNGSATRSTDYHRSNFDEISAMYEVSELETYLELNGDINDFLYFAVFSETGFTFKDNTVLLNDNIFKEEGFGFFDEYMYFFDNKMYGIIKTETVFMPVITQSDSNNVFLMDNRGQIYLHRESNVDVGLLHLYISADTTPYINNQLARGEKFSLSTTIEDEKTRLSFFPLDISDKLYIGQVYNRYTLDQRLFKYNMLYGLILGVVAIGNFGILTYIYRRYRISNLRFENILKRSIKFKGSAFSCDSYGNITYMSDKLKALIGDKEFIHINDFTLKKGLNGVPLDVVSNDYLW